MTGWILDNGMDNWADDHTDNSAVDILFFVKSQHLLKSIKNKGHLYFYECYDFTKKYI